jgi:hypothetical protein
MKRSYFICWRTMPPEMAISSVRTATCVQAGAGARQQLRSAPSRRPRGLQPSRFSGFAPRDAARDATPACGGAGVRGVLCSRLRAAYGVPGLAGLRCSASALPPCAHPRA